MHSTIPRSEAAMLAHQSSGDRAFERGIKAREMGRADVASVQKPSLCRDVVVISGLGLGVFIPQAS
jgi:hypothetical protein